MMLQLIDRRKIYFYLVLLLILLSTHNLNSINYINDFFKKNTLRDIAYKMEKNKQSEITK